MFNLKKITQDLTDMFGDDWCYTGSVAVWFYATSKGIDAILPNDIDVLVKQPKGCLENIPSIGKYKRIQSVQYTGTTYKCKNLPSLDLLFVKNITKSLILDMPLYDVSKLIKMYRTMLEDGCEERNDELDSKKIKILEKCLEKKDIVIVESKTFVDFDEENDIDDVDIVDNSDITYFMTPPKKSKCKTSHDSPVACRLFD